jgi:hypothetical protein
MRKSLDEFLAKNQTLSVAKLKVIRKRFETAINRCENLWGEDAFKRYDSKAYRDQFMSALYDAQMIAAFELSESKFTALMSKKAALKKASIELFKDSKFVDSVRVSTNTPSKLVYRITKVKDMLAKIA